MTVKVHHLEGGAKVEVKPVTRAIKTPAKLHKAMRVIAATSAMGSKPLTAADLGDATVTTYHYAFASIEDTIHIDDQADEEIPRPASVPQSIPESAPMLPKPPSGPASSKQPGSARERASRPGSARKTPVPAPAKPPSRPSSGRPTRPPSARAKKATIVPASTSTTESEEPAPASESGRSSLAHAPDQSLLPPATTSSPETSPAPAAVTPAVATASQPTPEVVKPLVLRAASKAGSGGHPTPRDPNSARNKVPQSIKTKQKNRQWNSMDFANMDYTRSLTTLKGFSFAKGAIEPDFVAHMISKGTVNRQESVNRINSRANAAPSPIFIDSDSDDDTNGKDAEDSSVPVLYPPAVSLPFKLTIKKEEFIPPVIKNVKPLPAPVKLQGANITGTNGVLPDATVELASMVLGPPIPNMPIIEPTPGAPTTVDVTDEEKQKMADEDRQESDENKEIKQREEEADKEFDEVPSEILPHSSTFGKTKDDILFADAHSPYQFVSRARPLSILIIGKPCAGKLTLAQRLASVLGVKNITTDAALEYARASSDANLNELASKVDQGQTPTAQNVSTILQSMLASDPVQSSGYVLGRYDITGNELAEFVNNPKLANVWPPQIIVDLDITDQDAIARKLTRQADALSKLAKKADSTEEPPAEEPELEQQQEEEEDEEELKKASLEGEEVIKKDLLGYKAARPALDSVISVFPAAPGRKLMKINACQPPEDVAAIVLHSISQRAHITQPTPVQVDPSSTASSNGNLLEVMGKMNLETDKVVVNEVFGVFQCFCPVSLKEGKLVKGENDFAVSYLGNVYLFASEEKMKTFTASPQKFLEAPQLPENYTVAFVGPSCAGKTTMANKLASNFGFKVMQKDSTEKVEGRVILDGFPTSNLELDTLQKSGANVDKVLYLSILDVEELPKRAAKRAANEPQTVEEGDAVEDKETLMDSAFEFQEQKWPQLKNMLEEEGILVQEVPGLGRKTEVLLRIRQALDPFFAFRANATKEIGFEDIEKSKAEGSRKYELGPQARALRYGQTTFCPVTLIDENLLVPGKDDLAVRIGARCYSVYSKKCIEKVLAAPRRYHLDIMENQATGALGPAMPGLRVMLTGLRGAGKTTLAKKLGNTYNIRDCISVAGQLKPRLRKLVGAKLEHALAAEKIAEDARRKKQEEREAKAAARAAAKAATAVEDDVESEDEEAEADGDEAGEAEGAEDKTKPDVALLSEFAQCNLSDDRAYSLVLEKLLATEIVSAQELQQIMKEVLHSDKDLDEPRAQVCEVDIYHSKLVQALSTALQSDHAILPHIVVPFEVSNATAVKRLLKGKAAGRPKEEAEADVKKSDASNEEIMNHIRESGVVVTSPLDTEGREKSAFARLTSLVDDFLYAQRGLFMKAHDVSIADAQNLLKRGAKVLRPFGTVCPVALSEGHRVDCLKGDAGCFPVMWAHYVVYTCSEENREELKTNLVGYLSTKVPPVPVPPTVAVVGPPMSSKTTVSNRLASDLDLVYLDMPTVLERVVKSGSALGQKILSFLQESQQVPDKILVQALKFVVECMDCKTKGWVLDDFPLTDKQAQLMDLFAVVPDKILSLEMSDAQAISKRIAGLRAARTEDLRAKFGIAEKPAGGTGPTNSDGLPLEHLTTGVTPIRDLTAECDTYRDNSIRMHQHWLRNFDNLVMLDGSKSRWAIVSRAFDLLAETMASKEEYHQRVNLGLAAVVKNMPISRAHIQQHLGPMKEFCPVSWLEEHALRSNTKNLDFTVEYKQTYYRLSSIRHLRKFLANPQRYSAKSLDLTLPKDLPFRLNFLDTRRVDDKHCELGGYCPVTIHTNLTKGKHH